MRRRIGWIILIMAGVLEAQTMSIQVEKAALRRGASFLRPVQAFLPYATSVKIIERKGAWVRIAAGKQHGWVHESILFSGEIVTASARKQPDAGTSQEEIMLAGRGFNPEVESEYQARKPDLRYDLVDAVQAQRVDTAQLKAFGDDGDLSTGAM